MRAVRKIFEYPRLEDPRSPKCCEIAHKNLISKKFDKQRSQHFSNLNFLRYILRYIILEISNRNLIRKSSHRECLETQSGAFVGLVFALQPTFTLPRLDIARRSLVRHPVARKTARNRKREDNRRRVARLDARDRVSEPVLSIGKVWRR